jgi:hypothetical protein
LLLMWFCVDRDNQQQYRHHNEQRHKITFLHISSHRHTSCNIVSNYGIYKVQYRLK